MGKNSIPYFVCWQNVSALLSIQTKPLKSISVDLSGPQHRMGGWQVNCGAQQKDFHKSLFLKMKWGGGGKCTLASLEAQMEKKLPAMQETWAQSLGQEDPLEKEMATYSSILAWRILWTEEPGSLQSMGSQRVRHDWATNAHPQNKNPLHWWPHSCPHSEDGAMPEAPRAWFDYVPTTL